MRAGWCCVLFFSLQVLFAGENSGLGVNIGMTLAGNGTTPIIIASIPVDGSSTSNSAPVLRATFDQDMDTTRTNTTAVYVPPGLTVSALVWIDARTLEIQTTGNISGFGAHRVDFVDRYFMSAGNMSLALNSGFAFNFISTGANDPPQIASMTATPQPVAITELVSFAATATDPDNDALTYTWNFGDGSPVSTGANVQHAYAATGAYTVTLTVSDGGFNTTQNLNVIVGDGGGRPVIVSTTPVDGSTITSNQPALRVVFNVDMDTTRTDIQQVFLPTGLTATALQWTNARTLDILYTGQLASFGAKRVDLRDGYFINPVNQSIPFGSGYSFFYGANNSAPLIASASVSPQPAAIGEPASFASTAVDPDGNALTYSWNFGDSTPAGAGANPTHVYTAVGTYTAVLTVSDGVLSTQQNVTVVVGDGGGRPVIVSTTPADGSTTSNAQPALRVVFSVDMNTTRTSVQQVVLPAGLTATALQWSTPRTLDILYTGQLTTAGAKRVDLKDNYFVNPVNQSIPTGSGYSFIFGTTAQPNGAPQIASISATPQPVAVGDTATLSVNASDPNGDALTYIWDFGDNTPSGNGPSVPHVYTAAGSYTATVTVSDGNGGSTQRTVQVIVADGGGRPIVVDSSPADGSGVTTNRPPLRVMFNVDMDTSRTDIRQVGLPAGMDATALTWIDARTLEITYTGQLDTYGAKRVDLKDGYFMNTVNQAIPLGSGFAFSYVDPNNRPFIVVSPTAEPPIAIGNNPIQFTVLAFDPDGDALTYTWDFGDGTSASGATPSHTYATNGPFVATVTANDGRGGLASASLLLSAPVVSPWTVTKASISLNFAKPGRDKVTVTGALVLPPNWDPTNKKVIVNVSGNTQTFTLNKNGQAKAGKDRFKLTRKLKKKVFLGGAVKITFTIGGALAEKLAAAGLTNADTPKAGVIRNIDMMLTLDGQPYVAQPPVQYKAKKDKNGRAKQSTPFRR